AKSLGDLSEVSDAVVDALLSALNDENREVCSRAAKSLIQLGSVSDAVVDTFLSALNDGDSIDRIRAAESLGNLSTASEMVVDSLVLALSDKNLQVRSYAAKSLIQLGSASDAVLDTLLASLRTEARSFNDFNNLPESWDSDAAIQSLITLSKKSDIVKPAIVEWIEQNQDEAYVGKGIDVLWEISGGQSTPTTLA
ncbi:MAG: HEAT repeat domain-containing protein, partial [Phormidesmis sp.]